MDRSLDEWGSSTLPDEPSLVRPYTLTAGRTASGIDIPLEAPISAVARGSAPSWPPSDVRAKILRMGVANPNPSAAEIAARLSLPLGVARVLIGDLVTLGYLRIHATLASSATAEDRRELIGRTLRGLRAL